jgi:PAS domain S-box-containing protein
VVAALSAADALRAALLHALGELGDGYVLVEGRRVVEANEAYQRLTGYSLAELQALPSLLSVLAPEEAERTMARWMERKLAVPADEHYETVFVRKDGRRLNVELSSAVVDPARNLVLSVARDVTARKRAEDALRASQERLMLLAKGAIEGIVVHRDGVIENVNPAIERMIGQRSEEMRGRPILDYVAPHDRERAAQVMRSGSEAPYEADVLRRDGTSFPAEIVARTMAFGDAPVRVVAVRDVTERREQVVAKTIVRRLLSDLSDASASSPQRRELGRSLAQGATAKTFAAFLHTFHAMGLGELRATLEGGPGGRYEVTGRDLLEKASGTSAPTCHIALGYLEAAITALAGAPALGAETACQSQGAEACRFVVMARRPAR